MSKVKISYTIKIVFLAIIIALGFSLFTDVIFDLLKKIFDIALMDIMSTIVSGITCAIVILIITKKRFLIASNGFMYPELQQLIVSILSLLAFIMIYDNTLGLIDFGKGPFLFLENYVNQLTITHALFVSFCITGPIIEELAFRVILIKKLLVVYSAKWSIIISALAFGIIHLNYHQGVKAFFFALLMGVIYYYSRSFLLIIFLHISHNTYIIVSEFQWINIYKMQDGFNMTELVIGVTLVLISIHLIFFKKNNLDLLNSDYKG